ncbi:ABC transporter permease [Pseudonocardia lacus]|uniref:ABC transporter permease n=1 Tax=Pseudonocardia lacus TaxID=2835865 RepID=UPI002028B656|nr:ABC transporter permease [Pseudonocardia lacus]
MTTVITTAPADGGALRWTLSDSWVVARRDLLHWVRNPSVIIASVAFPAMFVLLFGFVFGSAIVVPGGGDYREFLMPGMFAQAMVNGAAATVATVAADKARGVTDRFRSMPMAPAAPVIGRSVADVVNSVLDLVVLVGLGLLVGWRAHGGVAGALTAVGLLLLLRFAMIWVGIWLGLVVSQEAAGLAWAPLFPLTMIANTFVHPSQLPGWLGPLADWNPISATVTAVRELFGNIGPVAAQASWAERNAMLLAVAWPLVIVAVFLPLAVRRYRRAAA